MISRDRLCPRREGFHPQYRGAGVKIPPLRDNSDSTVQVRMNGIALGLWIAGSLIFKGMFFKDFLSFQATLG